jgi:hypothetical protein
MECNKKIGTGKIHVTEQIPSLLINDEKIKEPEKVADVFSSYFNCCENLILHQVGKEDPISFLKDSLPCRFHSIKIVLTSEAQIRETRLVMMK